MKYYIDISGDVLQLTRSLLERLEHIFSSSYISGPIVITKCYCTLIPLNCIGTIVNDKKLKNIILFSSTKTQSEIEE